MSGTANAAPLNGITSAMPNVLSSVPRYSGLRVRRYGPSASSVSPCIACECTTVLPTYAEPHTRNNPPSATQTMAAQSSRTAAPSKLNTRMRAISPMPKFHSVSRELSGAR